MNTIIAYAPTSSSPSNAIQPPTSILAVNANNIAIRIKGTNEADRRIASLLAFLYDPDAELTLSDSLLSAVKDLMVVIP